MTDVSTRTTSTSFTSAYSQWFADLGELIKTYDSDSDGRWTRQQFHHAMWMVMALGGNQAAFASDHGYQATTVSRWVNGGKSPPPLRRSRLVRDAYDQLSKLVDGKLTVPLRAFAENDEKPEAAPTARNAGRPLVRLA